MDQKYLKNRVLGSAGSNHTCDPSGPNAGENIMDPIRMKGLLSNCHNTQPIITRVTMDQSNVKKGLPLLLRCEASGIPSPRIEWQAPNGDVYRMMKDDFEGF